MRASLAAHTRWVVVRLQVLASQDAVGVLGRSTQLGGQQGPCRRSVISERASESETLAVLGSELLGEDEGVLYESAEQGEVSQVASGIAGPLVAVSDPFWTGTYGVRRLQQV
jgi:hypothetical protein